MHLRPRLHSVAIAALLAIACVAGRSEAQEFLRSNGALGAADAGKLDDYADRLLRELRAADADRVVDARRRVVDDLTRPGVTAIGRRHLSDAVLDDLIAIANDGEPLQASNAYQIAARLRTAAGLRMLAEATSTAMTDDASKRIAAASMLALGARASDAGDLAGPDLNAAIRATENTARDETHWIVLVRNFEALVEIGSKNFPSDDPRERAINSQGQMLETIVGRLAGGGDLELAETIFPSIVRLRGEYLIVSGRPKQAFNQRMPKSLAAIFQAAAQDFDRLNADPRSRVTMSTALQQAQVLLGLVKGRDAVPSTSVIDAWESGDADAFRAAARDWIALGR